MLALVTCHIFPPLNLIRKTWIPGTWLPGWQLAVFQSPRLHECGPADAHGNAQPFAWTNVSSGKNACFAIWPHVGTKFFNLSHHFLSMDGWPGDAIFFLWGQPLKIIHKNSAKKKVQQSSPLDFIFDTCASASSSHFFWLVKLNICGCTLLQGQLYFQQKNMCFAIWARVDTKFLNSSHHVLSVDDWPGDATFFLWGQPLKIIRKYSVKKGPAPWILFLTRVPRPLEVTFFGWWSWTYVVVPLLQGQLYFQKKKRLFCNLGALTQNSWIRPIMSYLWMIGLEMRLFSCGPTFEDYPQVFSQKKVQPLGFYFWHLRLDLFKSLFWLVKLNMCVCTLLQGQLYFQQKNMCFAIWARVDTKFLNSSHHVLSVDDWPGDATFFLWGQPLKIIRKYSVKKGPAPWILFLTPAPWPLEVTFSVGEGEHMCLYPFAKSCKESYPLN